jgi:hypothetical protein
MRQLNLPAITYGPRSQSRTDGLSIIGRVLNQLSFPRMEPMPAIEAGSAAYQTAALPLSYIGVGADPRT